MVFAHRVAARVERRCRDGETLNGRRRHPQDPMADVLREGVRTGVDIGRHAVGVPDRTTVEIQGVRADADPVRVPILDGYFVPKRDDGAGTRFAIP